MSVRRAEVLGPLDMAMRARQARQAEVGATLALYSDTELTRRIQASTPLGQGIGGSTARMQVAGQPVFVKGVRLTDLECQPEHRHSTANLFLLPSYYQRNVGSAGFGAWRELAAHEMANAAVLAGRLECVPLLLHWRVLELPVHGVQALGGIGEMTAFWGGSVAVRKRQQALAGAQTSLVLFLEHLPSDLATWLDQQKAAGPAALRAASRWVEDALCSGAAALNATGLLHGDAHFRNILTCGKRLYFADFGLATSERFALAADERRYLAHHASLDRAYVRTKWVNWWLQTATPELDSPQARFAAVQAVAQGAVARRVLPQLPPFAAAGVQRHATVAARVNAFYVALHTRSRRAPYPRQRIEAALAAEDG